jgi:muramidase (phage lysozyme)
MSKLTKYEKAALDLIAYTEGTLGVSNNGYDVTGGHRKIVGWDENTSIIHNGKEWYLASINSSVAGRYQFKKDTWMEVNGGNNLPLTKNNQDLGGAKLLAKRLRQTDLESRSVSLSNISDQSDFDIFLNKIAREWASIPLTKTFKTGSKTRYSGSSYYADDGINKTRHTPSELYIVFKKALQEYS